MTGTAPTTPCVDTFSAVEDQNSQGGMFMADGNGDVDDCERVCRDVSVNSEKHICTNCQP